MRVDLPPTIEAYFAADNGGDPARVADCFTATAVVTDDGHSHAGRDAIRRWVAAASAAYTHTVEPVAVATDGDRTVVTGRVTGSFPGSPVDLRYVFGLDGDRIAALEIKP